MRFYRLSFLQEEPIVPMRFEHMRDVGQHSHEFYEIVIVLRGKATHYYGNTAIEIAPGDLLLISPYLPHSYGVSEPNLVMNILFSPSVLWGLMSPAEAIQFICLFTNAQRPGECQSHRSSDEISRIALMMHEEYETRKENYRLKLRGLLLMLSVEISRQVAEKPVVDYDKFIRVWNVLEEFHQDVGNSWDVPELASRCGWSNEHFSRVFSSLMGQSCSEYIRNVRMSRGARLLFDPNNSIGQIASQVGYSDERSFRRAFKVVYGVTPGRFRQQQGRSKAI